MCGPEVQHTGNHLSVPWLLCYSVILYSLTFRVPSLISATMMDRDEAGQDMGVGKLGTQAEKDRRLKKK